MRTQILARYMVMFGIGSVLGPSVFGLLVERYGWSAVFSFRAPIALAAFLLAWTLPRPARPDAREAFDAIGGALLAVALGFLLLALNQLRHPGPELAIYLLLRDHRLWPVLPARGALRLPHHRLRLFPQHGLHLDQRLERAHQPGSVLDHAPGAVLSEPGSRPVTAGCRPLAGGVAFRKHFRRPPRRSACPRPTSPVRSRSSAPP